MATLHYADDPSIFPLEGGCCCGYVRYRVETAPLVVHCCHCTSCQRELGAAFATLLMIESFNLSILPPASATTPAHPGAPDIFPTAGPALPSTAQPITGQKDAVSLLRVEVPQESGAPQTVTHCPKCMVAVWSEYPSFGPSLKFVRGGMLDRAWLIEPDVHLYVRSKRNFFKIEDGKPQFEEYYDRKTVWRAQSLERWAKILPEIEKHKMSD